MFTRILLSTDGSEHAENAAVAAAALARRFAATLLVLHVFTPPSGVAPLAVMEMAAGATETTLDALAAEERSAVGERARRAIGEDVPHEFRQEAGHAADVILRVAEEGEFDLIVMGNRGLSGVARFVLGSVSQHVSQHAPCSVLIVR
jgi:nucleotide-binding universal stress UspA family protein